jgi:hypothetical protein
VLRLRQEIRDEERGGILHSHRVIATGVCSFPGDFPIVGNKICVYRIDITFGGSTWVELPES